MKDPHTGAFAVIWACVYFLLYAAAFSALPYEYYLPFGGVFVAARALSGLSVVMFPKAGGSGLAAMFSRNAKRLAVEISMAFYLMITAVFWVFVCPAGSWCCIPVLLLVYGYYYVTATREFGGVTGDLAGYFLQLAELSCLAALALAAYLR